MRFYTKNHQYYCGIDLHAMTMYVCILNSAGEILVHRNIRTDQTHFLALIEPYRDNLVVSVECIFTWYWIADVCAREHIAFVLGHALYMKAIHGGKVKNDKLDSHKIALLLKGSMLPQAYVYPAVMRATRDLLRRRLHLARQRAPISRTPCISTTCRPWGSGWASQPSATASRSVSPIRWYAAWCNWTWTSSRTTTSRSCYWNVNCSNRPRAMMRRCTNC